MFVVKFRTPSRANYEHFHVYLAYRRQTGTVVTRQTYDRAPRLTRPPTAHISRGVYATACFLYVCNSYDDQMDVPQHMDVKHLVCGLWIVLKSLMTKYIYKV